MKISVGSRASRRGNEPYHLCLGRHSLPVCSVLDRHDEGDARIFEVRVLDGRHFVVRRQTALDQWELVAVYGPGHAVRRSPPVRPAAPLLAPVLVALYRRALDIAKRARKLKSTLPDPLPKGDAPA
jgi:hypothetical protein